MCHMDIDHCMYVYGVIITDKDDCHMHIPKFDHLQSLADTCAQH